MFRIWRQWSKAPTPDMMVDWFQRQSLNDADRFPILAGDSGQKTGATMLRYESDDPGEAYAEALRRIEDCHRDDSRTLDISHLGLKKVPPKIGQLKNFTELILYDNRLTKLPSEIGSLAALTNLELDKPKRWGNLRRVFDKSSGDHLWLCHEHRLVLNPALPVLPQPSGMKAE